MKAAFHNTFAHPWTTAAGFGAAVLTLCAGGMNWKMALVAAAVQGLGAAARDPNAKAEPAP